MGDLPTYKRNFPLFFWNFSHGELYEDPSGEARGISEYINTQSEHGGINNNKQLIKGETFESTTDTYPGAHPLVPHIHPPSPDQGGGIYP